MAVKTFTTGEVLTAADTNTYLANGGLVYIKSQTVGSAVTSVTVNDAFSATYDAYKIVYTGGAASATAVLQMTLSTTATGYYYVLLYASFGVNTPLADTGSNTTRFLYVGQTGASGNGAEITVINPFLAKTTYVKSEVFAGSGTYAGLMSGTLSNTTSYTSFVLSPNSGTITGGTITVYGYRLG